jgi:hypothetical protein
VCVCRLAEWAFTMMQAYSSTFGKGHRRRARAMRLCGMQQLCGWSPSARTVDQKPALVMSRHMSCKGLLYPTKLLSLHPLSLTSPPVTATPPLRTPPPPRLSLDPWLLLVQWWAPAPLWPLVSCGQATLPSV